MSFPIRPSHAKKGVSRKFLHAFKSIYMEKFSALFYNGENRKEGAPWLVKTQK